MKNIKNIKKILSGASLVLLLSVISTSAVKAMGTLEPQGEAGDDTHKSLEDFLSKLNNFTYTPTAASSPFSVPGSVTASFPTLTEIYDLLEDENADLIPANIAQGVTIFGIEGELAAGSSQRLEWSADSPDSNLYDADDYCSDLVEGGNSDWSLPSVVELYEGYFEESLPLYNTESYWSSEEVGSEGEQAYTMNPDDGQIGLSHPDFDVIDFSCVREI